MGWVPACQVASITVRWTISASLQGTAPKAFIKARLFGPILLKKTLLPRAPINSLFAPVVVWASARRAHKRNLMWKVMAISGNVGIGTTSPQAKLDVAGKIRCEVLE